MKIKNIILVSMLFLIAASFLFVITCTGSAYKTGAFVPFEYAVPDGLITDPAEKEAMIQAKISNLQETNKIFWGNLPADTDVLIKGFGSVYSFIRNNFAGFEGLDIDFDKIGEEGFERIEEGLDSYGEFAYMLTHMSYLLQEGHSYVSTKRLSGSNGMTPYRKNVPIIDTNKISRIGVCITVTQKDEIVVTKLINSSDNPYNFKPGDEIVGFNGVSWLEWYPRLLEAGIPINGSPAAGKNAIRFRMIESAATNAMTFEKINIKRYGKEEIETLPIVFKSFSIGDYDPCAEYFDNIPNIKAPKIISLSNKPESMVHGIIKDTNIGYIYAIECPSGFNEFNDIKLWNPLETEFSNKFSGAISQLKNTDGIIFDLRLNYGGRPEVFYKGLAKLIKTEKPAPTFVMLPRDSKVADIYALEVPSVKKLEIDIPHDEENYTNPIVVLSSPDCISAGDLLVALCARFPEFKIIGLDNNASFAAVSPNKYDVGEDEIFVYITSGAGFYVKENPDYNGPTIDEIRLMEDFKQRSEVSRVFIKANYEPLLRRQDFVDEYVWFTKDDIAKGIDTVRERAIKLIQNANRN